MRQLHCQNCGAQLGTIRDARLRNDLVAYCGRCSENLQVLAKVRRDSNSPPPDFFKALFPGFTK